MSADERPTVTLRALDGELVVCRLAPDAAAPQLPLGGELFSVTRTREELSVVCAAADAPPNATVEPGWRALAVVGPLDFGLTDIPASLAEPLSAAAIAIFALSTYDTDYVLVRDETLPDAIEALRAAGHDVRAPEPDQPDTAASRVLLQRFAADLRRTCGVFLGFGVNRPSRPVAYGLMPRRCP